MRVGKLIKKFLNLQEKNDGIPAGIPVNFRRPPTLQEQIAQFIHSSELRQLANQQGFETFEESEDFDVPDDGHDMVSPHERYYDEDLQKEFSNAERPMVEKLKADSAEKLKKAQKAAVLKKQQQQKNESFTEEKPKRKMDE